MPTPTDETVAAIARRLLEEPGLLDRVLPGYQLTRRPETRKEIAARTLPAANAARLTQHQKWVSGVYAVIKTLRAADPAISNHRIMRLLAERQVKPPRGGAWTMRTLRSVMEAGARLEPQPPEN